MQDYRPRAVLVAGLLMVLTSLEQSAVAGQPPLAAPLPTNPSPANPSPAQLIAAGDGVDPRQALPSEASEPMLEFLASLVREAIPEHHIDARHWNRTKRMYAGFKVRNDGWRLETKRRWKEVNHGLWRRYEVDLVNPDETLEVRLSDVYWTEENRLHFDLRIVADARVRARQARWNLDIQLYSIQVVARARVRLEFEGTVGLSLDPAVLPPALVVDPHIARAELDLASFEVDRIGQLGGDLAEELGDAAESLVRSQLVEPQSRKLADRLNHKIDARRERLRFSAAKWWTPPATQEGG